MVWTTAGFGVMSIAAAFAWDYDSLLIIRLIEGLALGGQVPVSNALYSEFLPKQRRARSFLYGYTILYTLGIFLAPFVGLGCFALFELAIELACAVRDWRTWVAARFSAALRDAGIGALAR